MASPGDDPTNPPDQPATAGPARRAAGPGKGGDGPQWRVEGPAHKVGPQRAKLPGGGWFWLLVVGMLAFNFALATRIPSGHPRIAVPYSYFRGQAQAGNVAQVTSKGDTIQGSFRHTIRYPAGSKGKVTHLFKTERPAFADDQLPQARAAA